jgi:hypothetical protein
LLTACSALVLASCGGDEPQVERPTETETAPTIKRDVAERLASRSDKIASLLDSGDSCGAHDEAARLRGDLTSAINDRAIPEPYLEDLSGLVNEISVQIPPCEQPKDEEEKKDEEQKKDEGDD